MEYDLSLREYWRIVKKRKSIVLFSFFLMAIFSASMTYLNKPIPIYEASSTVKVEKSSTTTGIFLEALTWSGADFLETQASIITSYPIMEKVAKELGLIDKNIDTDLVRSDNDLIGVVLGLKNKVTAEREGNSNLINIITQSNKPSEAQEIANTVARIYTREHTNEVNKRTYDSRKFIENQLVRVEEKLRIAENQVRSYREQHKLVSLDSQTSKLLDSLSVTEAAYMKEKKSIAEMEFMIEKLANSQDNPITSKDSFYINEASTLYKNLNAKLVELLLKKDNLLLTYTDEHPKVEEINNQVSEITNNMQAQLKERISIAQSRGGRLEKKIEESQHQLLLLPGKKLKLARLEREVNLNEKVVTQLQSKLQEANIMEAAKIEEVTIVKPALEPQIQVNNPQVPIKALAGGIIGIIIGIILAFLYETFDTSIGAIEEIEEFTSTRVLGTIPAISQKEMRGLDKKFLRKDDQSDTSMSRKLSLITHFKPNSVAPECYRAVRTNIQFATIEGQHKVIGLTSAIADEGKSTTLVNLAIALAQSNNKVLLVEADLRKPGIARVFGIDQSPGLTDIILGSYEWRDIVQGITDLMLGEMDIDDVVMTPGLDNLQIIPCGTMHSNPAELLSSDELESFIADAKKEYDVVLIDLPPLLAAADASIVSAKIDTIILVYLAGKTARGALKRAIDQIQTARVEVLGIIINGLKADMSLDYNDFHFNQYYESNGSQPRKRTGPVKKLLGRKRGLFSWHQDGQLAESVTEGNKIWWKIGVVFLAFTILGIGVLWQA